MRETVTRIGIIAIMLAIMLLTNPCARAQSSFSGTVQRPFPTLMPLDYSSCRAQAWLLALHRAVPGLPSFVDIRLRELDLDISLGKLAICAMLYPVEVVTPDISASVEITVYLDSSNPAPGRIADILRDQEKLIMEMCLIAETEEKINKLREIWPTSLTNARERLKELEFYSNGLKGLWEALKINSGKRASFNALSKMAATIGDSPVAFLMEATALLDGGRPQRALEAATAGIRDARGHLAEKDSHPNLWKVILAKCFYARGIAHWRLHQPALAEADFDGGINAIEGLEHKPAVYAPLLQARGALRGRLRDVEGMCRDYVAACGLGNCQGLAEARAKGMCGNMGNEPAGID